MKNVLTVIAITVFVLAVTAAAYLTVGAHLRQRLVDYAKPRPPDIISPVRHTWLEILESEQEYREDEEYLDSRTGDAAKAMADFELGKKKSASDDKEQLKEASEHLSRVIDQYQDDELIPEATLSLGRVLVKLERWEEAKKRVAFIKKDKFWLDKNGRAEMNFLYGLCLEKLGSSDDAIKVYNAVIAVYGDYPDWSCQALERGFNLAYAIDAPEKKVKAYSFLKKILYMFQNFREAEVPSGALSRLRERLPRIRKELGITAKQEAEINWRLGLPEEKPYVDPDLRQKRSFNEIAWSLNAGLWICMVTATILLLRSARKDPLQFWNRFAILGLIMILTLLGYWLNASMTGLELWEHQRYSDYIDIYTKNKVYGSSYDRRANFIFQGMIGTLAMMTALVTRKIFLKSSTNNRI